MKSIKEKSLEVFPEHCNFYTNSCNERKRIGFEAGANYVLECIEEATNICFDEELKHVIEQLKE